MIEHRGRKPLVENVGEKVNKLAQQGFSFKEIAEMLGLKSRQLARYHFQRYHQSIANLTNKSKGV